MKYLFYNPIEIPAKIKIKASCFNLDMEYEPADCCHNNLPVGLDDLFYLAKAPCFDEVQVYLTSHNDAYFKKSKSSIEGTEVTGWVNLRDYKNGGGWHKDRYPIIKMNEPTENSAT